MTDRTAIVVRGLQADLDEAEAKLTRSVLYIPRILEITRVSGRSRKLLRQLVPQWPGYAFVTPDNVSTSMLRQHKIRHLLGEHVTHIPISQLEPSRILEIESMTDPKDRRPLPPLLPEPGDLVSVPAGRWGAFHGIVLTCEHKMVVVEVPHSLVHVRADPRTVTILDRKNKTCSLVGSAL